MPSRAEHRALRQAAGPLDDIHSVPEQLRDIDARLLAWGSWCKGGRGAETSPMFRLFRQTFARADYGSPTAAPAVDSTQALAVERAMRCLPERAANLLRGWYVHDCHPHRLARFCAIRLADLPGELNAARRMAKNVLCRMN